MLNIAINVLLVIHILVSLLIILLVLMQRPKNEGLGAAFGGGMTENLFGAQTTNVLAKFTRYLGGVFFVLTLFLSFLYAKQSRSGSSLGQRLSVPAATTAPATPAPGTAPQNTLAPGEAATPAPAPLGNAATPVAPATPEAVSARVKAP